MRKYHYAINQDDQLIHIDKVTIEDRANNHYYCVGCGTEMSPVLGSIRDHHFRHKEAQCSQESYLHKLCKRKLKERFDTQKEFIIKYYIDYDCNTKEGCKLAPLCMDHKCDRKELLELDLKKLYDTCEEEIEYKGFRADLMLSSKEYPEREPIFLEISVSHDCESKKLQSGIQIIELKIAEENDVLRPLIEERSLFSYSHSDNPYDFNSLPPIRFYNFKRCFEKTRPLDRFCVVKDNHGILRGYCAQDNLNCRDVESNHRESSIYEIAIPSEVRINNRKPNLYEFGMIKAIHAGINVKHCALCNYYGRCLLNYNEEVEDAKGGVIKLVPRQRWIHMISDNSIDKVAQASGCKNYSHNKRILSNVLNNMRTLPFWEWKKTIGTDGGNG